MIPIDFDHTHFINLCHNFRTFAEAEPDQDQLEEIYKLALHLDSYSTHVIPPKLMDFYLINKCLIGTDVELAWTDISSKASYYSGIYEWEDDYFFVNAVCGTDSNTVEINHLGTCPYSAPLFLYHIPNKPFRHKFEIIFEQIFSS
ncbi:hypothetical protein [Echinicola shivajiensis]|uniref:hypothetical protein n=1 Tax=Echinicola shivajiensis TaxID=1035916 RepID=UPI001BFCB09F|nr:hypothetical protein [Echinicola shivajiensis]